MKHGQSYRRHRRQPHPLSFVLMLLMGVLLPLQLAAQSGARITKIDFTGNETFSDSELRTVLTSGGSSGVSGILGDQDAYLYDPDLFTEGLARVRRFYQQEGFIRCQTGEPDVISFDPRKDEVKLRVSIDEGRPIVIDRVEYEIPDIDESERTMLLWRLRQARDEFLLQPGARFRDSSLLIDRDSLVLLMSSRGYPYATIGHELHVDTGASLVVVLWKITTGAIATFGETGIAGNERFDDRSISRMLAYRQGQRYDRTLVLRSQKQVYGLGVFQVATVHPQLGDSLSTQIPVNVAVREGARYKVKVGFGYGREEQFRAYGDVRKYGLFGGPRTLRVYVKHSTIEPYLVRLSMIQPAFFHPRTTLTVGPYLWRQDEEAFDVRRIGGDVQVSHTFSEKLSGAVVYTYEDVKNLELSPAQRAIAGDVNAEEYTKSTLAFGGQFDNSWPKLSPSRGFFLATNLTLSGLGFGSDFHFWKVVSEGRHYQSLRPFTLALRAKIGGAREFADKDIIPFEERLFSGGSNSVRGWGRQELGPRIADDPVGGRSLFEGNAELRFPIYGLLTGAAFCDFGNVWLEAFDYPIDDLRYSAGLGIRLTTPIGPIRLDVAAPVADVDKTTQIHISVGQAF